MIQNLRIQLKLIVDAKIVNIPFQFHQILNLLITPRLRLKNFTTLLINARTIMMDSAVQIAELEVASFLGL